jgi:hypothetical protein
MTIHTLRTIAEEFGVEKRTVQNWYARAKEEHGEFGEIDKTGTRQFSNEQRDILIAYASPAASKAIEAVEVSVGSEIVLTAPEMPDTYSLEVIRGASHGEQILQDPLGVANRFLQISTQLIEAMQVDISARERRLVETRRAKEMAQAKAQELQIEAKVYQLQSAEVSKSIKAETRQLESTLKELGKFEKSS